MDGKIVGTRTKYPSPNQIKLIVFGTCPRNLTLICMRFYHTCDAARNRILNEKDGLKAVL
jgi:hypothetical protein